MQTWFLARIALSDIEEVLGNELVEVGHPCDKEEGGHEVEAQKQKHKSRWDLRKLNQVLNDIEEAIT